MSGFILPDYIDGQQTWFSAAPQELIDQLHNGCPEIGWEGDPRLYIAPRDGAEGYAVGRLSEDGTRHLICVSKPPHRLDKELLIQLRDHDTRKVNVLDRLNKHNAAISKAHDDRATERLGDAMERVVWGLKKDVGYHY